MAILIASKKVVATAHVEASKKLDDVVKLALKIVADEEALNVSDAARLTKAHEWDALDVLTRDYQAQATKIISSHLQALQGEYRWGMSHERHMLNLPIPL